MVEPIAMIVPRKSESFQDDIYPETQAPVPSLTGILHHFKISDTFKTQWVKNLDS